jgi:hypothetical protein
MAQTRVHLTRAHTRDFSPFQWLAILPIPLLLLLSASCGSSGSPANQNMSSAQAQAVSQQIVTTLQGALSASLPSGLTATPAAHPSLSTIIREARPAESSSDCTGDITGETCNIPVSYSGACPGGGTMAVAGNFDFTLNNSGDGSDSTTLTITPTNCSVSNLTINGDPDITLATKLNFQDDQVVFPFSLTEGGGISYGPNPSGSCTLNVTLTVASTGSSGISCTVTGTICGQSVAGSC